MGQLVNRFYSACLFTLACVMSFLHLCALAEAASINVSRETVINQPRDIVWETMGHFNALEKWHPAVVSSQISGADVPTRLLILGDGSIVREELIDYRENSAYTYKIVGGPFPVKNYISTISVEDVGGTRTRVTWKGSFDPADGVSRQESEKTMVGVYEGGLSNLKKILR